MTPPEIDLRSIPRAGQVPAVLDALRSVPLGESLLVQDENALTPIEQQAEVHFGTQFSVQTVPNDDDLFVRRFTRRALPRVTVLDVAENLDNAHFGPQWGTETDDFNVTLLNWEAGHIVEKHINVTLDVIVVGIAGRGEVQIDGAVHALLPNRLIIIPRGSERSILCIEPTSYLSIHRRRPGLMPTTNFKND